MMYLLEGGVLEPPSVDRVRVSSGKRALSNNIDITFKRQYYLH